MLQSANMKAIVNRRVCSSPVLNRAFSFPVGRARARCTFSRRLPGKLISAGSCGRAAGSWPVCPHPTAFRFSVRRRSSETSLVHGRGPWAAPKGLVNARRRCVEARALPAGGLLSDGVSRGSPRTPAPDLPRPSRRARARRRRLPCTSSCPPPPAPRGGGRAGGAVVGARPDRRGGRPRRAPGPSGGACVEIATPTPPVPSWQAVARLGCPAAPLGLAARALRRDQPAPAREGRGRPEPREGARLGCEPEGRQGVDSLDAGERLDWPGATGRSGRGRAPSSPSGGPARAPTPWP